MSRALARIGREPSLAQTLKFNSIDDRQAISSDLIARNCKET
jgi:hypothetical protein